PVVALISGDAGMGKTRLTAELAARAAPRGFTVLSGRCAELGDAVPYLPLADALRNATTGPSASRPLHDALAARPVLSRLLPDLGTGRPRALTARRRGGCVRTWAPPARPGTCTGTWHSSSCSAPCSACWRRSPGSSLCC